MFQEYVLQQSSIQGNMTSMTASECEGVAFFAQFTVWWLCGWLKNYGRNSKSSLCHYGTVSWPLGHRGSCSPHLLM